MRRVLLIFCQMFMPYTFILIAQVYKVEYKNLPSPLMQGNVPNICILEDEKSPQKLLTELARYEDFASKYTSYSSADLADLKDILQITEFNPEDEKFLKSLNEQLSIEYLLDWKTLTDTANTYQLTIYATKDNSKLYSHKFYPTLNSTPFLDVKKLLVDNLEPIYTIPTALGAIVVNAKPETTSFILYKCEEIIKEWTGSEKLNIEAGRYRLKSESGKYLPDERYIEILEGQTTTVTINLQPEQPATIPVASASRLVSNLRSELQGNQIKITFDLVSSKKEEYDVELNLLNKTSGIRKQLSQVTGDVKGIKPGSNKIINWLFGKDLDTAQFSNYEIQLTVNEKAGGIAWYIYAGGGAALLGGAIALLGGGGDDGGGTTDRQKIGTPPERP